VFTSLPDPAAVSAVYDEILGKIERGAVAVDLSTIDPGTAIRTAQACHTQGVSFLDAPVSRGVQAAALGTLSIMVGGDADVLERTLPVLDHLATSIIHCGANGAGQMVKLCNNMVAAITMAALGEVLVAGVHSGLSTELLYQVMQSSSGGSHILSEYFPRVVFTQSRPTGFSLDFMVKDVDLYLEAVADSTAPAILGHAVRDIFRACQDQGLGARDATAVVEFYERPAGVRLEIEGMPV
jgi:3-hydroxyisobutyrate dehydrogenase-like beta-hydroxyacid dehydrogenase